MELVFAVPQTLPLGSLALGALFLLLPGSLAEEKTCKTNTAGELPREADWWLALHSGPLPECLLIAFTGSCHVFAALAGGFLPADLSEKTSGV